jgi:hypothetical protein
MKTALLPIALLALSLPAPALAYPAKVVYRVTSNALPMPAAPVYRAPLYGQPTYQTFGAVPGYGAVQRPPVTVVRYRVPGTYSYGAAPAYAYPSQPTYRVAAAPFATPVAQTCRFNPTRALVGAALGGLASTALAPRAQDRSWAVPVGAALGGLGGLATGC